ncbi:hypothetical protein [Marinifilum breve]|nr:hypothetical protein [Marinifilum breve]
MKHLIIILLVFFSCNAKAKYRPLKLYEMVIKADKIVYGTISELDSTTLTLKIEGSLTNDSGTLKIERFEDWTCASRWTEYKIGQRVFLFLTSWKGKLIAMSAGNEGELPIVKNSVFLNGFSVPVPPPPIPLREIEINDENLGFKLEHYNIYGDRFFGTKFKLDKFIKDISFIRKYFDFEYGTDRELTNWKIKCEPAKIEQRAKESDLIICVYLLSQMK